MWILVVQPIIYVVTINTGCLIFKVSNFDRNVSSPVDTDTVRLLDAETVLHTSVETITMVTRI